MRAFGAIAGRRETIAWGFQANGNPPVLSTHDRTGLRDRRGRLPSGVARAAGARRRARAPRAALARAAAGSARGAGGDVHPPGRGRGGGGLSAVDDLLGGAGPASPAGRSPRSGCRGRPPRSYDPRPVPAGEKAGALCGMAMTEKQGGSDVRANTTHGASPGRRRPGGGVRAHRPQVVLLGADVRRFPGPGPGAGRALLLPPAALHAGRRAQPFPPPAPEGQARQPLERFERGRVPRRLGPARRRGGARRADDPRDGEPHPARLRDRLGRRHAPGGRPGDPLRAPPPRLRPPARRAAADARTSSPTWRSSPRRRRSPRSASPAPTTRRRDAAAPPRLATAVFKYWVCKRGAGPRPRRWSAWAATATSRSGGWRASTARRRSTRSGRARATSSAWTCCGPSRRRRSRWRRCWRDRRGARRRPAPRRFRAGLRDASVRRRGAETRARRLVERLALALQGSLLVRHAPPAVADAFCAARLAGGGGRAFGTLPPGVDQAAILERHAPGS